MSSDLKTLVAEFIPGRHASSRTARPSSSGCTIISLCSPGRTRQGKYVSAILTGAAIVSAPASLNPFILKSAFLMVCLGR